MTGLPLSTARPVLIIIRRTTVTRELAATGVNPMPGLATASALLLVGVLMLVESRSRRRPAGISDRGIRKSSRLG
jgi:hypothetical protein